MVFGLRPQTTIQSILIMSNLDFNPSIVKSFSSFYQSYFLMNVPTGFDEWIFRLATKCGGFVSKVTVVCRNIWDVVKLVYLNSNQWLDGGIVILSKFNFVIFLYYNSFAFIITYFNHPTLMAFLSPLSYWQKVSRLLVWVLVCNF